MPANRSIGVLVASLIDRYRALPTGVRLWLPYWLLAATIFTIPAILGAAVGTERTASTVFPIRRPGGPAPSLSAPDLFAHNAGVALGVMAGAFTFGLYGLYVLGFNGFLLGSVVADAAGVYGLGRTLLLIVPHGIVEVPAIWLAGAVAFRWVHVIWSVGTGATRETTVPATVVRTVGVAALTLVLLAVAAVIEASVTALFVP